MSIQNRPKLKLGSAGEEEMVSNAGSVSAGAKQIPMFKDKNLYPGVFSEKSTPRDYWCTILPSFDLSLDPTDKAYAESYMPCRYKDRFTREGAYAFTGWYLSITGHTYYGLGKSFIVSPLTWGLPDPLAELYAYVKPKERTDVRMAKLLDFKGNNGNTFISRPTILRLLNVWGPSTIANATDPGEKNRILCLKPMAFEQLVSDLNRTGTVDNRDKNWPNHIFGDPTDPERAIICKHKLYPSPTKGSSGFFGLELGSTAFTRDALHLDAKFMKLTPEMLRGRFDLEDILYAPDYEEIMDVIVSDGKVPMDIIQTACSRPPVVRKTYVAPEPVVKKEEPVFDDIPLPSPAPVPVSTPATPAPNEEEIQAAEARFKEVDGLIRAGQGTPELVDEFRALRDKIERVRGIIGL